jgi:hypothetical protein
MAAPFSDRFHSIERETRLRTSRLRLRSCSAGRSKVLSIVIALLFLILGTWQHGRALAVLLFLAFLALGLLELTGITSLSRLVHAVLSIRIDEGATLQ